MPLGKLRQTFLAQVLLCVSQAGDWVSSCTPEGAVAAEISFRVEVLENVPLHPDRSAGHLSLEQCSDLGQWVGSPGLCQWG